MAFSIYVDHERLVELLKQSSRAKLVQIEADGGKWTWPRTRLKDTLRRLRNVRFTNATMAREKGLLEIMLCYTAKPGGRGHVILRSTKGRTFRVSKHGWSTRVPVAEDKRLTLPAAEVLYADVPL